MKKILAVFLCLLCFSGIAVAQEQILYRDTFTILWDAPEIDLLTGESVAYRVYTWDMALGVPTEALGPNWIYQGETPALELAVTLPTDQRREYAVGVQSVLTKADATEEISSLAITTDPLDIDPTGYPGVPFVYAPDGAISEPENLRDLGM